MVGDTLKKIRKDKNIPIRLICDGIMDSGNYWRLENNKIDSSFSTVLKLLERMNISIEEFTEEFSLDDNIYKSYEKKLVIFFKNKDIKSLKLLRQKISSNLRYKRTMRLTHLYYLTDIYIAKIDKNWVANKSKKKIKNYLIKCSNWNSYELALLNNVLFIYTFDICFLFYRKAISKFSQSNKKNIIPLTLNIMTLSIEKKDREKTLYLLSILNKIKLEEKNTYELMTQQWGICIAQYYLLDDSKYIHEAEEIVSMFLQIGMNDTYSLYRSWTNSYKEIINT